MASAFARQKAAQAWQKRTTQNHILDPDLAEAFAEIIDELQFPSAAGEPTPDVALRPMAATCEAGGPDEAGRDKTPEEVRLERRLTHEREKADQEHSRQQCVIQDKTLRVRIDAIIQDIRKADEAINGASDERWWTVHYLTNAVHWLGQDLKRLGEANPYPNSRDASNTKVDPTAQGLKL